MAEPMERLRAELAEARAIYDGREKTPDGEAGPQAGAVNAVDAVVTFLCGSGVPDGDLEPLINVLAAFRDHSRGTAHPLFAKKKRPEGGAPFIPSQHAVWRAVIAATVTLLVRGKVKKNVALAAVANSLKKSGFTGVTATKIGTWHHEISNERFGDAGAVQIYKSILDEAAVEHPGKSRAAAEDLLAGLPSLNPPQEL